MSTSVSATPERQSVDSEIGRRVFHLMWDRKITQTEMGKHVGVSQAALSNKLRGDRPWYSSEIRAAAAALGVTVGYLFGETENPHPVVPGEGSKLPGLDSNQEPIGFQSAINTHGKIIRPEFGGTRGLNKKTLAPVLKFRRA